MNKKTFIISSIVLLIDQIVKILTNNFIEPNSYIKITNNISLVNVTNTGAAFSILEGKMLFLITLSIIILYMIIKMRKEFDDNKISNLAFGLLTGGILGNLCDRLFLGMVRDFIKVNIFNYNFPVFNLADSAIVIGVIILIIKSIVDEVKDGNNSKQRRKS